MVRDLDARSKSWKKHCEGVQMAAEYQRLLRRQIEEEAGAEKVEAELKQRLEELREAEAHAAQAEAGAKWHGADVPVSLGFPKGQGRRLDPEAASAALHQFAGALMESYGDVSAAFRAFDINRNGTLSRSEFTQYAKLIYEGDVTAVFKALDVDANGELSVQEFDRLRNMYSVKKRSDAPKAWIPPDLRPTLALT